MVCWRRRQDGGAAARYAMYCENGLFSQAFVIWSG